MVGRTTASQIASASAASVLFVLTKGFTYWGGISRTSWPRACSSRAQWCAPGQASMPIRQGGSRAKNTATSPRRSRRRRTRWPAASAPCTWKTFLAMSSPTTAGAGCGMDVSSSEWMTPDTTGLPAGGAWRSSGGGPCHHCRRRFYEIHQGTSSPLAEEALRRIGELYRIEAEIRGRPAEERGAVRQERSKPLVEALHAWLTTQLGRVSGRSTLAEAIRYALRHWQGLVLFLEDGRLELDNNTVERALRPIALGRKNTHDRKSRRRTRIGVHRSPASKSNVTGSAKARAPELYRRSLKHSCGGWLPQDRMR